ncbi:hypothetical protein ABZY09_43395 [Streptomyces sp. NPDC002928]|uniref:hypothetical protein n=1 Tax=Streptomyces sp. NPDC002928 TaxID=3154440 RepID=UPI00339DC59A
MTRAHLSTPSSEGRVLLDPPGPAAGWAQEEAFTLLQPHIDDWFLAAALVDVAEGAGRDEKAAECRRRR